ncbi:aldo/keto reductase [Flavobacterium rhizosphaerae]|uniref:Aldo/keto reductase n=1 Tax=Flavobacterium rhizosphaerae TaxID=3163298 RepID=A0ABW8Z1M1_9FLAO
MDIKKTITIGARTANPLTVKRLGYGTMRLPGEEVWGEPENRDEALKILKATSEKGIQFLDTADYYGKDVTNRLISEALYPYNKDLVICTKVGANRGADKSWGIYDKPENLRASIDNNLKTLKIEQIPLVHFRVMPGTYTLLEESLNAMFEMQKEGKILNVGLSNVNPEELNIAIAMGNVASVENAFGYEQRTSFSAFGQEVRGMQEVMDICVKNSIPMIPFFSLQTSLPKGANKIAIIAEKYNATPAQINLAWLLHYNELILPIPGTSKLAHFNENIKALDISLSEEDMEFLG